MFHSICPQYWMTYVKREMDWKHFHIRHSLISFFSSDSSSAVGRFHLNSTKLHKKKLQIKKKKKLFVVVLFFWLLNISFQRIRTKQFHRKEIWNARKWNVSKKLSLIFFSTLNVVFNTIDFTQVANIFLRCRECYGSFFYQ